MRYVSPTMFSGICLSATCGCGISSSGICPWPCGLAVMTDEGALGRLACVAGFVCTCGASCGLAGVSGCVELWAGFCAGASCPRSEGAHIKRPENITAEAKIGDPTVLQRPAQEKALAIGFIFLYPWSARVRVMCQQPAYSQKLNKGLSLKCVVDPMKLLVALGKLSGPPWNFNHHAIRGFPFHFVYGGLKS